MIFAVTFYFCMPSLDVTQHHNSPSATAEENSTAGEQVLVTIYNGKPGETLDFVRYKRFCEKVVRHTSHIQPQTLPPTSAAAKFHSLHVYFQVQQWKGTGDGLLPEEWGWRERVKMKYLSQLLLICCLLQMISCVLFDVTASQIVVLWGVPEKNWIACSIVCGNCKGSVCMNSTTKEVLILMNNIINYISFSIKTVVRYLTLSQSPKTLSLLAIIQN